MNDAGGAVRLALCIDTQAKVSPMSLRERFCADQCKNLLVFCGKIGLRYREFWTIGEFGSRGDRQCFVPNASTKILKG